MRASSSKPQLLLVFKHQGLRALIGAQLLEEGYRVRGVATLEEALNLVAGGRVRPAVVILDTLQQPLTLAAMDSLPSSLALLVCTGPLDRGGPLLSQRPQTVMLQKPFTLRELVDAVRKICYKKMQEG
ncbi:MAG TPA: hypothetical protein VJK28_01355 [Nitrospiria bacterium]|nr:hypothetical protein [Nitrospiria bacterium]